MIDLSRRQFTATVGAASMLLGMTGTSVASNLTDLNPLTLEQSFQSALRDIGTNPCFAANATRHSLSTPIGFSLCGEAETALRSKQSPERFVR